jgi:SAM-dependent methyltransferase
LSARRSGRLIPRASVEVLEDYLAVAPAALAAERSVEALLYMHVALDPPVLDIGCGDGLFAAIALPGTIDVGIDPDGRELECARRLGSYGELIECPGHAVPRPDGSFGTIISNSVLEHISNLEPVLREAHRLLRPGGRFYFTVPTEHFGRYTALSALLCALRLHDARARWHAFYDRFWKLYHAYPKQRWCDLATDAGFEVLAAEPYWPRRMCLMGDFLRPLALRAKIRKDRTGCRWVSDSALRRAFARLAAPTLSWALRGAEHDPDGGLVFLNLLRP